MKAKCTKCGEYINISIKKPTRELRKYICHTCSGGDKNSNSTNRLDNGVGIDSGKYGVYTVVSV